MATETHEPLTGSHRIPEASTEAEAEPPTLRLMVSYRQTTGRQMADRARDHLYN